MKYSIVGVLFLSLNLFCMSEELLEIQGLLQSIQKTGRIEQELQHIEFLKEICNAQRSVLQKHKQLMNNMREYFNESKKFEIMRRQPVSSSTDARQEMFRKNAQQIEKLEQARQLVVEQIALLEAKK